MNNLRIILFLLAMGITFSESSFSRIKNDANNEMPMSGINVGLGVDAFNNAQGYTYFSGQTAKHFYSYLDIPGFQGFTLAGELGYTFETDRGIYGILGQFVYDNNDVTEVVGDEKEYRAALQSHVNAILMAGIKFNRTNVAYITGGYSIAFGLIGIQNDTYVGALKKYYSQNGGIFGLGIRHYFTRHTFLNLNYEYALFKHDNAMIVFPATSTTKEATITSARQLCENGLIATLNYLF